MPFYSATESSFTRHYREEVAMAFSAIDCVLNGELAIYASTELTSGRRINDILVERRLKTASELRQTAGHEWFEAEIWNVNVAAAVAFARGVKAALGGAEVITPGPFTAPGWSQIEYLAFWETLLRTRISASWFNQNWEFSNGCTFEFAVAQDADLPTFDATGRPLGLREGVAAIDAAIAIVERQGLDASKLRENRDRLTALPRFRGAVSTR
jgi:hypothetical protein